MHTPFIHLLCLYCTLRAENTSYYMPICPMSTQHLHSSWLLPVGTPIKQFPPIIIPLFLVSALASRIVPVMLELFPFRAVVGLEEHTGFKFLPGQVLWSKRALALPSNTLTLTKSAHPSVWRGDLSYHSENQHLEMDISRKPRSTNLFDNYISSTELATLSIYFWQVDR